MSDTTQRPPMYLNAEAPSSHDPDREIIPRRLVYAMFGVALFALVLVVFAVLTDRPLVGQPEAAPVVFERSILIEGEGNAALVTDAGGAVLLDSPTAGFITVVRDGLEAERRKHRITANTPVTITAYENGRLRLFDPATGWSMELSSFGAGNRVTFDRLFK